jgi:phosphate starvation-inducible protein PhoH
MGRRSTVAMKQKASVHSIQAEREARQQGPQIRKKFTIHDLKHVTPLNDIQQHAFNCWFSQENNLSLFGYPGTGKTFLAFYLALSSLLANRDVYDKIIVVRSIVPVRDIGFLPGELEDKIGVYEEPYRQICNELFPFSKSWDNLKEVGLVEFHPTSFIRGTTWSNSLVIVDEVQNLTVREVHGILTRLGEDSKVILCGDKMQSDLVKGEQTCYDFLYQIGKHMNTMSMVEFKDVDMVVRSQFVREYLKARVKCNL